GEGSRPMVGEEGEEGFHVPPVDGGETAEQNRRPAIIGPFRHRSNAMDRLQSMRVFQQVVDSGGFAAAARKLDLAPAVVTRLVSDLEKHLGARLLNRTTRRLSLTQVGEAYLERLGAILAAIDEADAEAQSESKDMRGTARVLAPPVAAAHTLAPAVIA